jgi:hypothetical protein
VLFDNDHGAKAIKKYLSEFGEHIKRFFHLYSEEKGFALENFLSEDDQIKLLEITKTNDLKKAMALIYYELEENKKKSFISNLNNTTLKNLEATVDRINKL